MQSLMMDKLALHIFVVVVVAKHNSKLVLLTWRGQK
jgi:hypothetical protein